MKKLRILMFVIFTCAWPVVAETWQDRCVAAVLIGEAGNQGTNGLLAIMEVIHNRVTLNGRTAYQNISKPKQFSCLNGTTPELLYRKYRNHFMYSTALAITALPSTQMPGWTKGAVCFTRKTEKPSWSKRMNHVATIGDHAFYSLRTRKRT